MDVDSVKRWGGWHRNLLGVATIALAAVLQTGLREIVGDNVPFMFFHSALVVIAVYCGRGPALLALLLSVIYSAVAFHATSQGSGTTTGSYLVLIYTVVGVIIIVVTSTLQRAARRAQAAESRLRMIQDDVGVGLWEIDLRHRLLLASRSFWRIFGRTGPDTPIAFERWESQLSGIELESFNRTLEQHIAAGDRSFEHEFSHHYQGRELRHYLACVNIEYDEGDSATHLRAAVVDVTSRKRLEAEQGRHIEELREVDSRRTTFLATLAHELRNPLAPIRHATLLAQSPKATPEQVRWSLEVIERQIRHMARLLDDLLEASRVTRGALELRVTPVEIATVIRTALETARPLIQSKAHVLETHIPTTPIWLQGDAVRLAQVFSNLLTNAAKYTPNEGHIRIAVELAGEDVIVRVTDNGIGIEPHDVPRLFEMFSQADSAIEHAQGGLGIGLALVKGLVQLHGGTVAASSPGLHRGSEFVVRLPRVAAPSTLATHAPQASAPAATCRIVIADDNRDAADSLAVLLQVAGHAVTVAYDGEAALRLCIEQQPDVALLDIGMPKLDGYELARRLRAQPWAQQLKLIAITGWGQKADRTQALEAGFDVHLTKPVDEQSLIQLLPSSSGRSAAA